MADGTMPDILKPRDHKDIEAAVQQAFAAGKPLEVVGRGSKRGIGRPVHTGTTLDLSEVTGVILYEPEELVLSARAGTPLADIETLLAQNGQALAFEPIDYGPLLGGEQRHGTIGATLAANLSGPRRIRAGAARDHFLGFVAVSGRGETFKSGGRVVKNVTGFDLCKLMAGSWGTLGIMSEVTLKVLPRGQSEATFIIFGMDDRAAAAAMAAAFGSTLAISAAAHVPDYLAARFAGLAGGESATVFRLEGFAASAPDSFDALASAVRPAGATAVLQDGESQLLWRDIRDVRPFWPDGPCGDRPVWRISTAPSRGWEMVAKLSPAVQAFYDWAGGLVWVAAPAGRDGCAGEIRSAVATVGGHATLVRAAAAVREAVDPFPPQAGAEAALAQRIKHAFDPKGVLNPGRMWAGM